MNLPLALTNCPPRINTRHLASLATLLCVAAAPAAVVDLTNALQKSGYNETEPGRFTSAGELLFYAYANTGSGFKVLSCTYSQGSARAIDIGGGSSVVFGENTKGELVGRAMTSTGDTRAFLYRNQATTALGTLGGYSEARAVNGSTVVVGHSTDPLGRARAVVWRNGQTVDIGTLGGERSWAESINEQGDIVGTAETATGQNHAFLYRNGAMIDLTAMTGLSSSTGSAFKVTDSGTVFFSSQGVVGESLVDYTYAYTNGQVQNLSLGGTATYIYQISEVGDAVGRSATAAGNNEAFLWSAGQLTNLSQLTGLYDRNAYGYWTMSSGLTAFQTYGFDQDGVEWDLSYLLWNGSVVPISVGGNYSYVYSTRGGNVVGSAYDVNWRSNAFLWKDGQTTNIGEHFPNDSYAVDVNANGDVVGYFFNEQWSAQAFLYQQGQVHDVAPSGGESYATRISNDGRVAGYKFSNSIRQAFLYEPEGQGNAAPVVEAGSDQTLEALGQTTLVQLSGSASDANDGSESLQYQWTNGNTTLGSSLAIAVELPVGSHTLTLVATDPQGASSSDTVTIVLQDTTAPTISSVGSLTAYATAASGGAISFDKPTATDLVDGPVTVVCSKEPGSVFPLGTTQVDCAATDASGNSSTTSFTVNVIYSWSGLLAPRNAAKQNRTVPVWFKLTGPSKPIKDAAATFSYRLVGSADFAFGGAFRYSASGGRYEAEWNTRGLAKGAYEIRIDLGDGVPRIDQVNIR